jgi:tetratricopeptide (TPR) repeat protein
LMIILMAKSDKDSAATAVLGSRDFLFFCRGKGAMKKIAAATLACLCLTATVAWGQKAMDFYNRGLKSSRSYEKIEYFTIALELNPKLSAAYKKRGMLYYYQRKYNKTIQDFQRVTELEQFAPESYRMLGLAHLKKGDLDEAIVNLTRATELDPQLASAYSYRAEAYRLKGMAVEAIRDATKAIELGGTKQTIGRAYATRAKSYRELGQREAANADFSRALPLAPEYNVYNSLPGFLGDLASESSGLKGIGWIGISGVVVIVLVLILRLALPAPQKGDDR